MTRNPTRPNPNDTHLEWRATCHVDLGAGVDPYGSGIAETLLDLAPENLGAVTGSIAGALSITFSVDAPDIVAATDIAADTARSLLDATLTQMGIDDDIEPTHFRITVTRDDDPYGDYPHAPLHTEPTTD